MPAAPPPWVQRSVGLPSAIDLEFSGNHQVVEPLEKGLRLLETRHQSGIRSRRAKPSAAYRSGSSPIRSSHTSNEGAGVQSARLVRFRRISTVDRVAQSKAHPDARVERAIDVSAIHPSLLKSYACRGSCDVHDMYARNDTATRFRNHLVF